VPRSRALDAATKGVVVHAGRDLGEEVPPQPLAPARARQAPLGLAVEGDRAGRVEADGPEGQPVDLLLAQALDRAGKLGLLEARQDAGTRHGAVPPCLLF
jgi:hypothetical protein